MNKNLENAKYLERKQQTSQKVDEVFEIREQQWSLKEEMKKSKSEEIEPLQSSFDALNKSHIESGELMKDKEVFLELLKQAELYNKKFDLKKISDTAKDFVEKFIDDKGLSDKVMWDGFLIEHGNIKIRLIQYGNLLMYSFLTKENFNEIKKGIKEIITKQLKDKLIKLNIEKYSRSITSIFHWDKCIWDSIDITISEK